MLPQIWRNCVKNLTKRNDEKWRKLKRNVTTRRQNFSTKRKSQSKTVRVNRMDKMTLMTHPNMRTEKSSKPILNTNIRKTRILLVPDLCRLLQVNEKGKQKLKLFSQTCIQRPPFLTQSLCPLLKGGRCLGVANVI